MLHIFFIASLAMPAIDVIKEKYDTNDKKMKINGNECDIFFLCSFMQLFIMGQANIIFEMKERIKEQQNVLFITKFLELDNLESCNKKLLLKML